MSKSSSLNLSIRLLTLNLKRNQYLLKKYGITEVQYNQILRSQGGGCAICGKNKITEGKNLAVDHNHHSGEIRGVVCTYCNRYRIGRHRDPDLLRRIADYISKGTNLFVPKTVRKKKRGKNNKNKPIRVSKRTKRPAS